MRKFILSDWGTPLYHGIQTLICGAGAVATMIFDDNPFTFSPSFLFYLFVMQFFRHLFLSISRIISLTNNRKRKTLNRSET